MPVRKTESRLAANTVAGELGQVVSSPANNIILVSYQTTPVALGRKQTYVVFVIEPSLQTSTEKFQWTIATQSEFTGYGVFEFTPQVEGPFTISVSLLDASDNVLATLEMEQVAVFENADLESIIGDAGSSGATAFDPVTSKELINDIAVYIDQVASREDEQPILNKLLFSLAYAEIMHLPQNERASQTIKLSEALEQDQPEYFADLAENGIGVYQLRPHVISMFIPKTPGGADFLVASRDLPNDPAVRAPVLNQLKEQLSQLDEDTRIDLFNMLRFPKTNVKLASQFVESLVEKFFPGGDLPGILNDKEKAMLLITQFKEGPFSLS